MSDIGYCIWVQEYPEDTPHKGFTNSDLTTTLGMLAHCRERFPEVTYRLGFDFPE